MTQRRESQTVHYTANAVVKQHFKNKHLKNYILTVSPMTFVIIKKALWSSLRLRIKRTRLHVNALGYVQKSYGHTVVYFNYVLLWFYVRNVRLR